MLARFGKWRSKWGSASWFDQRLPGYVTAGLLLGYERTIGSSKVSFQFNVDNLLDKTYFENSGSPGTAYYGAPRTFFGKVRVEF